MGQSLASAAKWTSAKDERRGKLEYTPINELILCKVNEFVEGFSAKHVDESQLVFKTALIWPTQLTTNEFSSGYQQKSGKKFLCWGSGDKEVTSQEKTSKGQPLLTLRHGDDGNEMIVWSMEYAENALAMAGNKKLAETRACLEANHDPLANILGERFATVQGVDSSSYRFVEEIMRSQEAAIREGREVSVGDDVASSEQLSDWTLQEKKKALRLLLLLKDFDDKLLQEVVRQMSTEVKLTPSDVESTVDTLRQLCGSKPALNMLENIVWLPEYNFVFNNGCRAPLVRQLHGDIGYFVVKPHDVGSIYVTASTNGYFINKGLDEHSNKLNFGINSDYYRDLMDLLREKSPHFADLINKQDQLTSVESEFATVEDEETVVRDDVTRVRDAKQPVDRSGGKKDSKTTSDSKSKLEPSLKWKTLGLEDANRESSVKVVVVEPKRKRRSCSDKKALLDADESFEESSSESEEEEEMPDRRSESNSDLPSEYWQIQKLVKYLKGGNQTATIIALCALMDFNLVQETCQLAIRDVGGLEVLINLLDTDQMKCKIGALRIVKEISKNTQIRHAIADLGGLQTLVKILRDPNKELKCLAAETIANVARFRRARRTVRQHGGIRRLVALLDCVPMGNVTTADQQKDVEVARCGALALWSCSKSQRNKESMRRAGAIPLLARLLKSPHVNMLIPVVGTLQECATESSYRLAIRTEGMIEDLVKNLKSDNQELQMHCASAIFKCAEEKETRDLVRRYGGLDPNVALLSNTENKELLAAATGAIWKCAISSENVTRFQELKAIDLLVALLNNQPEEVLVNVVGALAELARDPPNRLAIRKAGGIAPLVNLLTGTNHALLINVTKAVGRCAEELENMTVIDKLDGVRLLWSLLKNPNPEVQASAAWAICPCIQNAKDAGEMVRSFVGGLELIVSLLKSDDREVLASVCAAIANIASDEENLAVITDHGVVPMLSKLTPTTDDQLRRHLSEAIARCCSWGNNRVFFGNEDAVAPLVRYLKSSDPDVHRSTARALHQLSRDPNNCITMHESCVVKPLMQMVGSEDEVLQEAAAGCIANIRRLALANEKARTK